MLLLDHLFLHVTQLDLQLLHLLLSICDFCLKAIGFFVVLALSTYGLLGLPSSYVVSELFDATFRLRDLEFCFFLLDNDGDQLHCEFVDLVKDLLTVGLFWLFWLDSSAGFAGWC